MEMQELLKKVEELKIVPVVVLEERKGCASFGTGFDRWWTSGC